MAVANLHRRFDFVAVAGGVDPGFLYAHDAAGVTAPGYRVPVHAIDFELLHKQIVGIANDNTIGRRIEIDYIPCTRRTAGKTFALSDGEQFDAVVFADERSINVVNFTAMKFIVAQM